MPSQRKVKLLDGLASDLEGAKAVILTDYSGLTHKQLEDLRRELRPLKASYTIVKNRLLGRAIKDKQIISDSELQVDGPTAALIAHEDEILPLKSLTKFIKESSKPEIKLGIFFGKTLTKEEVAKLATLPSRDALRAKLVGSLKSPLYGLHRSLQWNLNRLVWTVSQIKEQKEKSKNTN